VLVAGNAVAMTGVVRALKVLTAARAKNSDVLHPLSGGIHQRLSPSAGQAAAANPAALQAICDRLGPGAIGMFFQRWMSRLPLPLTEHDRAAGYWWELSMRQLEVSRTLVFDAPRHARAFFEPWLPTISTSAARTAWN
jgi:hypothetical protein